MKIQVNARNRAHHFEAAPAEKILHAGLSRAVGLPYECGSGTCGTCKARLLSGKIDDHWPDAPGRKYLKHADDFLMCQCSAHGDVTVEVAGYVQESDPGGCVPLAQQGRVRAATLLTHDVMELDVELETPLDFDAGQFVLVRMGDVPGARGWSMVNHERGARALQFVVKRKPGGALSEWLFTGAPEGAAVDVYGPLGSATFYPAVAKHILCIAGGSGIAGMMSILARAARERYFDTYRGDVFFGVRTMKDAFYLDRFAKLRDDCGEQLKVTVALSEEPASDEWRARYPQLAFDGGFVHEVAGKHMQGRLQDVRAYLAGPPPAVEASVRMLLMARVSTANIRYDKFS
ncbi:MAG: 2Fe-2S iron-sulfur cluster binding domain-containing protein [Proteobacteria bacterium]|nr:2Fe-2S iron-sulfur cluster binding domain-containing protein [Pseudomonadota bacterium]